MFPLRAHHHGERTRTSPARWDLVLIGGGLLNCTAAICLLERHPDLRLLLLEKNEHLCGDHTWSAHEADVPPSLRATILGLSRRRWPTYRVCFPGLSRSMELPFFSLDLARIRERIADLETRCEGFEVRRGCSVAGASEEGMVVLEPGSVEVARAVVDARGPRPFGYAPRCGYEKFFGLEIRLEEPLDGPLEPILVDCMPDQGDGFHFMYMLPFTRDVILVEDTYLTNGDALDPERHRALIRRWVEEHLDRTGYTVLREETFPLPMPWSGGPARPRGRLLRAGYGNGWFHPVTTFSGCASFQLVEALLADLEADRDRPVGRRVRALHRRIASNFRVGTFGNFVLLRVVPPALRHHLVGWVYGASEDLVARFFGMRMSVGTWLRLALHRPGIPFTAVLRSLLPGRSVR